MRYVRFGLLLATFWLSSGSTAHADITTDLVAHWPLDGDAIDISGNANHGTVGTTVVACPDRAGDPQSAMEFDGTSSWILVPNSATLESPTTELTQCAWIQQHGVSVVGFGFNPIFMKSTSSPNNLMYRLYVSPTAVCTSIANWDQYWFSAVMLPEDEWIFVASVFDNGLITHYVNGNPVGSGSIPQTTLVPDGLDFSIGGDVPGVLEVFNGKIDDARIYARALTLEDIGELYAGPTSTPPAFTQGGFLEQNQPNPFQRRTSIGFNLAIDTDAVLRVYDVAGRLIRSLEAPRGVGDHLLAWDARDQNGKRVPAGVYYYRLEGKGLITGSRKMIVNH